MTKLPKDGRNLVDNEQITDSTKLHVTIKPVVKTTKRMHANVYM